MITNLARVEFVCIFSSCIKSYKIIKYFNLVSCCCGKFEKISQNICYLVPTESTAEHKPILLAGAL